MLTRNNQIRIDTALDNTIAGLTPFQRATVDVIRYRFCHERQSRILVADEVGLGKTVIARGVIADMLRQHLQTHNYAPDRPLRVAYVCSNQMLATENRRKLTIFSGEDAKEFVQSPSFTRLAELAITPAASDYNDKLLEIRALTPATSFGAQRRGQGNARERHIIFSALQQLAELPQGDRWKSVPTVGLERFFQHYAEKNWPPHYKNGVRSVTRTRDTPKIRAEILSRFAQALRDTAAVFDNKQKKLLKTCSLPHSNWPCLLTEIATRYSAGIATRHERAKPDGSDVGCLNRRAYNLVRAKIRQLFLQACAQSLEADLFILDEFQRFRELLGDTEHHEGNIIAEHVFSHTVNSNGKVLLLSATPYKALTDIHDEVDAHARQLEHLIGFLAGHDATPWRNFDEARKGMVAEILKLRGNSRTVPAQLSDTPRRQAEKALRPYICRTERASIGNHCADITMARDLNCLRSFSQDEIEAFCQFDGVGQALVSTKPAIRHMPLIELHKAAPWPLSFLEGYKLRSELQNSRDRNVRHALKKATKAWIPHDKLNHYKLDLIRDVPHAKLREVANAVFEDSSEMLLWVPPCRPYYRFGEPFASNANFTKTLLFSNYHIAPRALSSLMSYEAERRLRGPVSSTASSHNAGAPLYFGERPTSPAIRFDRADRLNAWSLIYPSRTLCSLSPIDLDTPDQSVEDLISTKEKELAEHIKRLQCLKSTETTTGAGVDVSWYALAPFLLDWTDTTRTSAKRGTASARQACERWLTAMLRYAGTGDDGSADATGRSKALGELRQRLQNVDNRTLMLGTMPKDLPRFLATLAIAGPAITLYNSVKKVFNNETACSMEQASEAAIDFMRLFNTHEGQAIVSKFGASYAGIRSSVKATQAASNHPFWRLTLDYCVQGNLQATMDEYMHLLRTNGVDPTEALAQLRQSSHLRTVNIRAQTRPGEGRDVRFRCHYAVAISDQHDTEEGATKRRAQVRHAFNSPFWPFMLNSTSIGQEGLDFHWYCSRIVHWNLPSNPIDFEQREGRINRYKALVVRRRVAEFVHNNHTDSGGDNPDPWVRWFDAIKAAGAAACAIDPSGLIPYWHMPVGHARIERIVPTLPLSRDEAQLKKLLKILSLYRLAFGQPRQQELLDNLLLRDFNAEELDDITRKLLIDLTPFNYFSEARK